VDPAPEPEPSTVQLCAFTVGEEEYVVDLHRVLEVIPPVLFTPVPGAPAFVEGVAHLRGRVVPVVDLRKQLGVRTPEGASRRARFMVCAVGGRRIAFVVDRVTQVVRVARADLKPAPAVAEGPSLSPFVIGVCSRSHRLYLLLNLKAVLAR
jgi:purine-binding chemotaxis protein CheW